MNAAFDLAALLGAIADHPVLPPPGRLPPDSEELRSALGEIAKGGRSPHADLIRHVAVARHVGFDELVRRAGFVLACVVLPSSGSHYELLGVSPRASGREIRRRWATLIQRHHPDHAGSEGGLGDQARRLIEAYQTLRDSERRRRYDAELSRARGRHVVLRPVDAPGGWRQLAPAGRSRWAPAAIAVVGIAVVSAMVRGTMPAPTTVPSPASRPVGPASSEAMPADLGLVPTPRPPSTPGIGAGLAPPEGALIPSSSPPPLPSLREWLTGPESAPAPGAGDARTAESPRDDGRREPSAGATADLLPNASHLAAEPTRPPGAPDWTESALLAPGRRPPAPLAAAPAPPARPHTGGASEGWRSLIEAFRGAYERKDVDALNDLFADDVRERTAVGRRAVHELYRTNFQVLEGIRYEISQTRAQPGSTDGEVLVHGRFRIRAVDVRNGSRPLDVGGPIRWTLRREGAALRIVAIDYDARKQ